VVLTKTNRKNLRRGKWRKWGFALVYPHVLYIIDVMRNYFLL